MQLIDEETEVVHAHDGMRVESYFVACERGEIDRAIHLHNNLLERPQLSDVQRFAIMAELAQDYLKAGLFDRAEELFHALCASPTYHQPALRSLLDIYIRERDWTRAIETAGLTKSDIKHVNAHATGTSVGDVAEGKAINNALGSTSAVK